VLKVPLNSNQLMNESFNFVTYLLFVVLACAERSAEDQVLTVESSVYQPPSQLQLPSDEVAVSNSDSVVSGPESDDNSSDNSDLLLSPGPRYADEESPKKQTAVSAKSRDDQRRALPDRQKVSVSCGFVYSAVS